jgi:Xaa-Pro aminopeptidase
VEGDARGVRIGDEEFAARRAELHERVPASAIVVFDPHRILYYTGFAFIPTERPIALVLSADGRNAMLVPRLEAEHASANAAIEEVVHYDEFPGNRNPMLALKDMLGDRRVASDQPWGYPWVFGFRGPALVDLVDHGVTAVASAIEDQMQIKSETELALLRESCRWAEDAHRRLQEYTRPGATETEVERRASNEATDAMLAALGADYRGQSQWYSGAWAGYRGQIGRQGAIPHTLPGHITFETGDVVVTEATAPVFGYHSELERTMVLGPPSDEQKRLFEHMVALQDLAVDAIRPGVPCAEVDRRVRAYYEKHDLWPYWRHHSGHAIGLRYHEGPFLDTGDATEIRPGMVFTVEPGLYDPGIGGFRHSDTIAVTDGGVEWLTQYPRDLASLTLPDR